MRVLKVLGVLVAIGLALLLWSYREATSTPIVRRAAIGLPGWPAGAPPLRAVLISDIHVAGPDMPPARLAGIVGRINALKPDIVLIAGDLISDKRVATQLYSMADAIAPLAHLLCAGVGDTIRISYASDPVYEVHDGLELMYVLGLRQRIGAELIACPTCGRIQVDLFKLVQDVRKQLAKEIRLPIKVAVMGCVVNGPGEARGADIGIAAGNKRGHLFVKGQNVAVVPEDEMVDALVEWAEFIAEHGTDAALARVDLFLRRHGVPATPGLAAQPVALEAVSG